MANGQTRGADALGMTESPQPEAVVIRKCVGTDEFRHCVALQQQVWNFSDAELVPLRMFVVADKVGGQVIGAFDGPELVGFALSVPGHRHGHAYLHSHMAAVNERYRNLGVGRKLKLFQREEALSRNILLMEWTFDPLEIKNSFFNIRRLGAIMRHYNINQYGVTSSVLHGGLPTDRLIAEWWLRSNRVERLLGEGLESKFETKRTIEVPQAVAAWKTTAATRQQAATLQTRNREQFLQAFREGLAVLGYERDKQGNGVFLLGNWDEKWSYAEPSTADEA
jgi:predicted GNAT superfamily acetyltransferase